MTHAQQLISVYRQLDRHFGPLNWWPGETPFEVAVGAILTQNTSWKNVETAIRRLKNADLLTPQALQNAKEQEVALLIRPSGYYNLKTKRVKNFVGFLMDTYNGSMSRMFQEDMWPLRRNLLEIKGIGEETADSILLYAGNKPIFVVDAYTRRIFTRHGIPMDTWKYGEIQTLFMQYLPEEVGVYNQYHALIVNAGKHYCRKIPVCERCPLQDMKRRQ